ncbi:MAG: YicC/YloC family endoribonuclease [Candidatus Omnitrophota bacterium]
MINSMTGFGGRTIKAGSIGKISVELRSTNHKFLEVLLHVPDGFLSLEDKIKKEIESKIKRGRVVCVINIAAAESNDVFVNKELIKKYVAALKNLQQQFSLDGNLSVDTLIKLPGIISLEGNEIDKVEIWPRLKNLIKAALSDLSQMRQKEGLALRGILKSRGQKLHLELKNIKVRFKKAIQNKIVKFKTDEERSSFLKNADIAEEIDRLEYHIKNFIHKLSKSGPVGKELDFIAQEMQREANTMGAKSFDTLVSARVVQMKSQIEKIREQVQNIE